MSRQVTILAHRDSWYAQDLQRAAPADLQVTVAAFDRLKSYLQSGDLLVGSDGLDLTSVDAVIVRTMPPGSLEQVVMRMDVLHLCQHAGVLVVNPPRAVEVAVDKFLATARLRAAGLPVPDTAVCQQPEQARQMFNQLGGDVVCKPLFGSEGRGIFRLSNPDLAGRAFAALDRCGNVMYLQQFIPHRGFDWRVLVVGDQVWAMQRTSDNDWRTNIHRGATASAIELDADSIDMAIQSARAVGAPWAGVDLLPGIDGRTYILEVNAVPGWRALAEVHRTDIAGHLWSDLNRQLAAQQGGN